MQRMIFCNNSFDYEPAEYEESDLVKISMLINGDPIHILSSICHRTKAETHGRSMVQRLKSVLHRQQFEVIMQAAIGTRIIARERLQPYRKDVTAKLLENQKESKRRMKMIGRVEISHEAFLKFLKSE
jgi:GTP-binding protein LepA